MHILWKQYLDIDACHLLTWSCTGKMTTILAKVYFIGVFLILNGGGDLGTVSHRCSVGVISTETLFTIGIQPVPKTAMNSITKPHLSHVSICHSASAVSVIFSKLTKDLRIA